MRSCARFNPRVREGRDAYPQRAGSLHAVSIHASVKDATSAWRMTSTATAGFNPRVREGRDESIADDLNAEIVSIHASVKDATVISVRHSPVGLVSIHASVKDATRAGREGDPERGFQSTRP